MSTKQLQKACCCCMYLTAHQSCLPSLHYTISSEVTGKYAGGTDV